MEKEKVPTSNLEFQNATGKELIQCVVKDYNRGCIFKFKGWLKLLMGYLQIHPNGVWLQLKPEEPLD